MMENKENNNLIKIYKEFNTYRKKEVLHPKYYRTYPDSNYLVYVDFIDNKIINRNKSNPINFLYTSEDNNVVFIDKEFPGDEYSKALIVDKNSKLSMSPIDLSNINKFTIEIDLKIVTDKFDNIKLFVNNELNIYMEFEDGYLIVNINDIKLKNYYKLKKNDIAYIVLQRINNIFYLIINDIVVYIESILNIPNFIIDTIYENYSESIIYIKRYSISNKIRYDLKSLKMYPMDSRSLLYLPCNISSNIIKSDINTFDIDIKNTYFNKDYFKLGYGTLSNGTIIKLKSNKNENFSLYFWHRLLANNSILSSLDCSIIKVIGNDCVFEIKIENNFILVLKSYIGKKEESISFNISDKAKSLYNNWNSFAITFNIEDKDKCIFTIFLNGKKLYSNSLLYFDSNIINNIELFTEYLYGKNYIGSMYISSIRLSKGIYYNNNFNPNITGLLYRAYTTDNIVTKPKIIYSKYPKNDVDYNASRIFNKYKVFIEENLLYYFTFECWLYTTKNDISDSPMYIRFMRRTDILYTIYFTKDNKSSFIRTDNNISRELLMEKQWTHIAMTYSKDSKKIKIWINGNLVITENYKGSLIETEFLELCPGTGDSYFNDLVVAPSIKYINKNFIPPNTLLQQNKIVEYDEYQNIPHIIYNRHIFGDIDNCKSIANNKFMHTLTNYSDESHYIEFWIFITKNTASANVPLSIKIFDNKNNNIHEIILTKYLADSTDTIHWNKNITNYQVSNIVMPENIWVHFALIYNKSINKIQLYCNGVKILESEFKKVISLKNFKKIIIIPSSEGETYIEDFLQTQYLLYNNNFIPKNGKLSDSYLPIPKNNINNEKNTDRIGIFDNHYLMYLDFENQLEDKSKIVWKSYGFIQYVNNVFSYDKYTSSILLDGNDGIYTREKLNLALDKFTIELEIKTYVDFIEYSSALFTDFYNGIFIYLSNDKKIIVKYKNSYEIISAEIDLDREIYIALQKNSKILSLYINGILEKQITIEEENFFPKDIDHSIDIGMITIEGRATRFFNGYINKIAISDIARFDDVEEIIIPKVEKNNNIILFQPIKYPAYDTIYKTINEEEEWNWKYRRRNVIAYKNKVLNSNYNNYMAFGPSEMREPGYLEYSSSNIDFSHRSFMFEFIINAVTKTECKLMDISSIFSLSIKENSIICEKNIIDMGYNEFINNCRYFVITYNNYTKVLNLFVNGKLLFTNKYNNLLPTPMRLYTNCLLSNPIYFSSIRLSKGILYSNNFDISFIKYPYIDYSKDNIVNNEHKTVTNDTVLYLLSNNDTNDKARYTFTINNTKIYER